LLIVRYHLSKPSDPPPHSPPNHPPPPTSPPPKYKFAPPPNPPPRRTSSPGDGGGGGAGGAGGGGGDGGAGTDGRGDASGGGSTYNSPQPAGTLVSYARPQQYQPAPFAGGYPVHAPESPSHIYALTQTYQIQPDYGGPSANYGNPTWQQRPPPQDGTRPICTQGIDILMLPNPRVHPAVCAITPWTRLFVRCRLGFRCCGHRCWLRVRCRELRFRCGLYVVPMHTTGTHPF